MPRAGVAETERVNGAGSAGGRRGSAPQLVEVKCAQKCACCPDDRRRVPRVVGFFVCRLRGAAHERRAGENECVATSLLQARKRAVPLSAHISPDRPRLPIVPCVPAMAESNTRGELREAIRRGGSPRRAEATARRLHRKTLRHTRLDPAIA